MQITDLLKPQSILLNADPVTKADAIYTLGELMEKGGNLIDKDEYLTAVFAREESGSTGLGDGIATPHAKSTGVKEAASLLWSYLTVWILKHLMVNHLAYSL